LQPVLRGDSDVFITKIAPEPAVDLAVLAIRAPNRVTLHTQPLTRPVTVTIQNRSPRAETITDAAMLGNLVTLRVEPLRAGCPALVPVLRAGRLPVTLAPKQTLTVVFQVTFDPACVPDPVLSTKSNPGHEDYRYVATVRHEAIDGVPDTHPECDVCPRAPLGYDANPNGTILDTGCATVLTDVLLR
jgi:hypothetical protein